ncbi:MAG: N-6 DNA methylase [Gammaproteobacteria bacterium]|nr:N-6 DNA methylase [Gammaproteobacteria bacterium]
MKPQSKFSAIRGDNLNRFYTRNTVGDLIVQQISELKHPCKILDLGAGDGSLSTAVAKTWNNSEIVTVDIDLGCKENLRTKISKVNTSFHTHHTHNVFDYHLPTILAEHGEFDLAVCNPPFFKPEWSCNFSDILQSADMEDSCPSAADVTAEIIFLSQNLRLVKNGGAIVLIAPDGMLTGHRTIPLRRSLLSKHRVDCVIQLPSHSFHDTEARCFLLFLTKNAGSTEYVKLLSYNKDAGLSDPIFINRDDATKRLDYEYHATQKSDGDNVTTLRQLGAEIKRGSISTVEARQAYFPIFHTSDYNNTEDGRIRLSPPMPSLLEKRLVIAEPGDILMARVDRKLHNKVGIVVDGQAALTDCVYRVRLPAHTREKAFKALSSIKGRIGLQAISKGVSARLVGKADLLDLPLEMVDA